jgi:hypothetical protein
MYENMNNQLLLSYKVYPYLRPSIALAYRSTLEPVYTFPVK